MEYRKLILPTAAAVATVTLTLSYPTDIDAGLKGALKKIGKVVGKAAEVADSLAAEEARRRGGTYQPPAQQPANPQTTPRPQPYVEKPQRPRSWMDEDTFYGESELMTFKDVYDRADAMLPADDPRYGLKMMNVRIRKNGVSGDIGDWKLIDNPVMFDMESEQAVFSYQGYNAVIWHGGYSYWLQFERFGNRHQITIGTRQETEEYIRFLQGPSNSVIDSFKGAFDYLSPQIDGCGDVEITVHGVSKDTALYGRLGCRGKGNGKKFAVGAYWPRNSAGHQFFQDESELGTDFDNFLRFGDGKPILREIGGNPPVKYFIQKSGQTTGAGY